MSYRFITRATLSITDAAGYFRTRLLEVRAYPSPKRDPVGVLTVDGVSVPYKTTGGRGRGTYDRRYVYVPLKNESAYFEINEAEAAALIGGTVSLITAAAALAKFSAAFEADREAAVLAIAAEAEAAEAAALAAALARDVEDPAGATLASTFAGLFLRPAPVEAEAEEAEEAEVEEEEDEAEDESDYYEDESESEAPR